MELHELERNYTDVIGGGGYGIVATSPQNPRIAVKFLYEAECPSAKREYIFARRIYNAYKILLKCLPFVQKLIKVPKPIDFVENSRCAVVMERLFFPLSYAVHPSLTDSIHPSQLDKIIYTTKGIPRGYYLSPEETDKYITLEETTYRMGLLDGICIFGAGLLPIDVEYVIIDDNRTNKLALIDFGMVEDLNISKDNIKEVAEKISQLQEYSTYYHPLYNTIPEERKEECKNAYMKGLAVSYGCFISDNLILISLYRELEKIYEW